MNDIHTHTQNVTCKHRVCQLTADSAPTLNNRLSKFLLKLWCINRTVTTVYNNQQNNNNDKNKIIVKTLNDFR
jgi:hypothetical protein